MDDKNYISGIYNYCDRWCEKCSFTSNCLLFTNESKIITHEILNNGDLAGIEDVLRENIPDEIFEENSFPFDEEGFDDFNFDDLREIENDKEDTPTSLLEILADDFFDKSHALIKLLNNKFNLFPPAIDKHALQEFRDFYNNFETLVWYHTFVGAKIERALMGKIDLLNKDDEEMKKLDQQDVDGSAKIAAIGIEKIIGSLTEIYNDNEIFHAEIAEIILLADRVLNELDTEFPGYKEFQRPGFDD